MKSRVLEIWNIPISKITSVCRVFFKGVSLCVPCYRLIYFNIITKTALQRHVNFSLLWSTWPSVKKREMKK